MEGEVTLREREAAQVVSKRFPVRLSEIGSALGTAFGEVYGHLGARRVEGNGPPFVIYHEVPVADDPFDIEVCAPVAHAVDPPPGWQAQELPAGAFVTLLHVGPYDTVASAYGDLTAWIGDHDLAVAGPPREVYLSPPDTPAVEIRTIVEFPVARVAARVPTA
jgi:effector-binding domain-containing protein